MTDFSLWKRAQNSIAQGCLTNSKSPKSFVFGVYPTHIKEGQGPYLVDHEGKKYLDFILGLGANPLGYANENLISVLSKYLRGGFSHSLPTHHEVEAAEAIKSVFPFIERVKFLKTGSEACSAAIRIARAYRQKTHEEGDNRSFRVLSAGYHGWHDLFVSLTPPANGVPSNEWLRIDKLEAELSEEQIKGADCVIIEPIETDISFKRIEWLRKLRDLCKKHETILIFDEVITGFRFPKFSAARYLNILPDLIVCGKAAGGGLPIAFVGGRKELMDGQYFVSSTYAGEILSLIACKTTIELLLKDSDFSIEALWGKGKEFLDAFNKIWPEKLKIEGYPTRGVFTGDANVKALFFQESVKAGILYCNSWFLSYPMVEHLSDVLACSKQILSNIRLGKIKLEGELPVSPFAQKVRENGKK